jgi:hypothetical protein
MVIRARLIRDFSAAEVRIDISHVNQRASFHFLLEQGDVHVLSLPLAELLQFHEDLLERLARDPDLFTELAGE